VLLSQFEKKDNQNNIRKNLIALKVLSVGPKLISDIINYILARLNLLDIFT